MTPSGDHPHLHDLGLAADLAALQRQFARRRMLGLIGLGGAGLLASCGGGGSSSGGATSAVAATTTTTTTTTTTVDTSTCVTTPGETEGPYPADGSNSYNGSVRNVLITSGVVRNDIRSSFGGVSTTVADGVAMTLTIRLARTSSSCTALAGYAIYLWHCDRLGNYSLYSLPNENYLRGVAVTDSNGLATFTTIFPGCYDGRWPHMHFEIYPSLASATSYANKVLTSQFAMPADVSTAVYSGVSSYSGSLTNFAGESLSTDGIFRDNTTSQIASMTPVFSGDPTNGYSASVQVALA